MSNDSSPPFCPKWKKELYYALTDRLGLKKTHKIGNLSEGQRSQVVLGLIMAQQPEVLIFDDYTMGLDAGYRRLFLDDLTDYLKEGDKTVLVTSHIVQDMEHFVDDIILLQRGGNMKQLALTSFLNDFRQYHLPNQALPSSLNKSGPIQNVEDTRTGSLIYSFDELENVSSHLSAQGISCNGLEQLPMSFEEAFIGFTGRY